MIHEKNLFGEGDLYEDIQPGSIYVECSACMSIYSEFLSWANSKDGKGKFVRDPKDAKNIVVLSCQVTDLAVLSELRILEKLMLDFPDREFYVGGCLARRFDIPLPFGVKRLSNLVSNNTPINEKWMVKFSTPFWVKDFREEDLSTRDGHLFRNMYPLRIGAGCDRNCKYCTIKDVRGKHYVLFPNIKEFLNHKDVVLISDNPTVNQVIEWCEIAEEYQREISFRNVEPSTACGAENSLINISKQGLLEFLHVPIQSTDPLVLGYMGRNEKHVSHFINEIIPEMALEGTFLATNVIIDYKDFKNPSMEYLRSKFDYVSWNPYWDGVWDRKKAEERFNKYFGG